ncbi:MAG: hypothetical protein KZQ71_16260 [Candidatus Thiodiazotropha sp. (ex Lucinoma aequizonata)]|nr:hypothetical protein [Candidatus Thiodiazotropha sp. (ex Lucinoma aequizonata)]
MNRNSLLSDPFHVGIKSFVQTHFILDKALHHDYRNDSTASRMRSLYALHFSLSVAIPAIQPRLRLSGTNRLRSAFHSGQRMWISEASTSIARCRI